jgi:hypothetical protein
LIGRSPWLRAIGIDRRDGQNYGVTVRVALEGEVPTLPSSINGVAIDIVRWGLAKALEDGQSSSHCTSASLFPTAIRRSPSVTRGAKDLAPAA